MRKIATFPLAEGQYEDIKYRMLNWAKQFSILLFLDSNNYLSGSDKYECLLSVGTVDKAGLSDLDSLYNWHRDNKDWLFGHICYDYKNQLENKLSSQHPAKLHFPLLHFFCPQVVCHVDKNKAILTIETEEEFPYKVYEQIINTVSGSTETLPKHSFIQTIGKEDYIHTIQKLREHIADGDCYEINFCNEGYCSPCSVDMLSVFRSLNELSPAPFAAYYRLNDKYMACASPERYLKKERAKVLSQPIKGTGRREKDKIKDLAIKKELRTNLKEQAENVMIVDLVRNDLARSCEVGSIHVDELFGIYTFPQVHQMISTVSGLLRNNTPFTDTIRYSFPMGSMTGAPKVKVMQLIDKYEKSRRELFAGTVGYIDPEGNIDFNVIIRSLFYNETAKYLSYQTGGAITYDSDPVREWEEMRLKAWALERIFD